MACRLLIKSAIRCSLAANCAQRKTFTSVYGSCSPWTRQLHNFFIDREYLISYKGFPHQCLRGYASKKKAKGKATKTLKLTALDENDAVNIEEVKAEMEDVILSLKETLTKLSVRITPASFSDAPVQLEDGSRATIKQLGQIVTPQPDKILINLTNQPEAVARVASTILKLGLGLNPEIDGGVIKITLPKVTTELRTQLVKIAKADVEQSKKSLHYVRQQAITKARKAASVSKDEIKRAEKTVDTLTSHYVTETDNILDIKYKELMGTN